MSQRPVEQPAGWPAGEHLAGSWLRPGQPSDGRASDGQPSDGQPSDGRAADGRATGQMPSERSVGQPALRAPSPEPPAVAVSGLSKSFAGRKALDGLDFRLPQGAFLSVFGANGAGKSTLLQILATLLRPTVGSVQVLGYDLKEQPEQIRARIGVVSHQPMLYPDLSAQDNLSFYARLYGLADPEERVAELLDSVKLTHRRHDTVRGFSWGMTRRLAIARALVNDPQLLLLDEPVSGLDPQAAAVFDALIADIRLSRSFIMASHDLKRGWRLASHVLVLADGRLSCFEERDALGGGGSPGPDELAELIGTAR